MFSANTTQVSSGGYQISRSLRFNSADSAYLNRTPASNINRKIFTFSFWAKLSSTTTGINPFFGSRGSPTITRGEFGTYQNKLYIQDNNGSAWVVDLSTTAVFRDFSAWYHIVFSIDTTQATDTNRIKLYVNGAQNTLSGTFPTQNLDLDFLITSATSYWGADGGGVNYLGGYLTEINFIDGQALTPSSFGETNAQTGVWQPKAYSGSYGTNGFYLNFSDNSNTTAATLGKDYSGNGNNWTPNNFSVTAGAVNDSLVDSPTSYGTDTGVGGTVRGNYCTWNPLAKGTSGSGLTLSNGNLEGVTPSNGVCSVLGTIGVSSGKWYWEVTSTADGNVAMVGIGTPLANLNTYPGGGGSQSWGYYAYSGEKFFNDVNTAYGASYTNNDVIGVALDMDAGTVAFYKNGTSQGTAFTGLTGTILPMIGDGGTVAAVAFNGNFGQRAFAYTAPSGFKALCTQNLPTPTIGATTATQAGKYFNPVLYTGNGSTQTVTGVGFQPDFLWIKARSSASSHYLMNAVTGAGVSLESQSTAAEANYSAYLSQFNSDGFYMPTSAGGFNASGVNFVAWNWKANGSGSTNTAGSITSTVSANTTSGFSVVTYTGNGTGGATVGHGLGVAPSMVICKTRTGSSVGAWQTYHSALGATKGMFLNLSDAAYTSSLYWNNTAPTSSVFSLGGNTDGNGSGYTMVAYCFAEVAGYSKMGSWTGNGSSTGPFIYTGFRPAFVLVKNTTSAGPQWWILDNKRNTYNPEDLALPPSLSLAEQTIPTCLNFLSNGFQVTTTNGDFNTSGSNYIFMAIAENPFKYSLAR